MSLPDPDEGDQHPLRSRAWGSEINEKIPLESLGESEHSVVSGDCAMFFLNYLLLFSSLPSQCSSLLKALGLQVGRRELMANPTVS